MKLAALMLARNEGHEIGLTARAALMWADVLIVHNHASTDETLSILSDLVLGEERGRVRVLHDPGNTWREARHRQAMLDEARRIRATHMAIVDADEILAGPLLPVIRGAVESLQPGQILEPHWTCLARSLSRYYTAGVWSSYWVTFAFRDHAEYRWEAPQGYDHHHRHPFGPRFPVRPWKTPPGLMHLQFVSERRLRAKQFWYCLTERERWPDRKTPAELSALYGRAVYESCPRSTPTGEVPREWWEPYRSIQKHLCMDGPIWQEREIERMLTENPGLADGLTDWRLK